MTILPWFSALVLESCPTIKYELCSSVCAELPSQSQRQWNWPGSINVLVAELLNADMRASYACSYFLLVWRRHSYPAVKTTMATRDMMREKVPVIRHCLKIMQRFLEDQVKIIYCRKYRVGGPWLARNEHSWSTDHPYPCHHGPYGHDPYVRGPYHRDPCL